jgi:hypothetical protein
MKYKTKHALMALGLAALTGAVVSSTGPQLWAQVATSLGGFQDTPLVPGTQWHVHDNLRPQPEVITPGTLSTQETPGSRRPMRWCCSVVPISTTGITARMNPPLGL